MSISKLLNAVIFLTALLAATTVRAEITLIPSSRHHQYTSFGIFVEDGDSSLVLRNAGRAWGSVGGAIALLEAPDWKFSPQLVFFASASAAYRLNERLDTLLTETVDARVGLNIEGAIDEKNRILVGWTHQSGHISDNIDDLRMVGTNLGNEILQIRYVHDIEDRFRLGVSLRPVMGSEPNLKPFAANQFAEWFPFGTNSNVRKPTPFLSLGLEEYGVEKVHLTTHVQLGAYVGSHLDPEHHSLVRLVAGYYNGVDPRLKFAQFKLSTVEFGYIGLMLSI